MPQSGLWTGHDMKRKGQGHIYASLRLGTHPAVKHQIVLDMENVSLVSNCFYYQATLVGTPFKKVQNAFLTI